jgi:hypothetical protein
MRPPIVLGASLLAGFCGGSLVHQGVLWPPGASSASGTVAAQTETAEFGGPEPRDEGPGSVLGAAEGETFNTLPEARQRDGLVRLSAKILREGGTGDMLLLAKLVGGLNFDQAATLWEQLPKDTAAKPDPSDGARGALVERLAALDPDRVLQMGRAAEDPRLAQAAVVALAQKSGAEAIRAFAQLPDKFQASVASAMRGSFNDGLAKASGSLATMAAALKENPQLLDPKSPSEGVVRRFLGQVASQAAATDPEAAMAELRRMAAGLVQPKPGEDPKVAESALVARIGSQMTRAMRADAPESERVVFNSLADTEKNEVQVSLEAAARFRSGGVEEAIRFAEKQGKEQFAKSAASGMWGALAQANRPEALRLIELLQGSSREGALSSLMQEAAFRSRSWGDSAEPVLAGAELLSRSSKLDYYALLAGQNRGPGVSRSEFIAGLPLPEADKSELRRRMAPIRAK